MKNSNDIIGNRTRDLPACSAVPQPTAPPRAPMSLFVIKGIPVCQFQYQSLSLSLPTQFRVRILSLLRNSSPKYALLHVTT